MYKYRYCTQKKKKLVHKHFLNSDGSVEIVFEFSDIRKFTHVEIWTYGTSLRTTEIFFSTNGKKFTLASQISSIQVKFFIYSSKNFDTI